MLNYEKSVLLEDWEESMDKMFRYHSNQKMTFKTHSIEGWEAFQEAKKDWNSEKGTFSTILSLKIRGKIRAVRDKEKTRQKYLEQWSIWAITGCPPPEYLDEKYIKKQINRLSKDQKRIIKKVRKEGLRRSEVKSYGTAINQIKKNVERELKCLQ